MKKLVEWSDELSVGIEEIDEQHKILVNLLNRLHEAIITKHEADVIKEVLNGLTQYTIIHFAVEESLMRIFDFPGYEAHKRHHEELTKQVIDLKQKIDSGEAEVSMDVLHFLRGWLTNHIMREDKGYSPYFLKRGLKQSWSQRSWVGKIWDSVHHK